VHPGGPASHQVMAHQSDDQVAVSMGKAGVPVVRWESESAATPMVLPWKISATSHMPALMAAAACSTWATKDEPPIEVEFV